MHFDALGQQKNWQIIIFIVALFSDVLYAPTAASICLFVPVYYLFSSISISLLGVSSQHIQSINLFDKELTKRRSHQTILSLPYNINRLHPSQYVVAAVSFKLCVVTSLVLSTTDRCSCCCPLFLFLFCFI